LPKTGLPVVLRSIELIHVRFGQKKVDTKEAC